MDSSPHIHDTHLLNKNIFVVVVVYALGNNNNNNYYYYFIIITQYIFILSIIIMVYLVQYYVYGWTDNKRLYGFRALFRCFNP